MHVCCHLVLCASVVTTVSARAAAPLIYHDEQGIKTPRTHLERATSVRDGLHIISECKRGRKVQDADKMDITSRERLFCFLHCMRSAGVSITGVGRIFGYNPATMQTVAPPL